MDPVHFDGPGPWTGSTEGVHGPGVHVLYFPVFVFGLDVSIQVYSFRFVLFSLVSQNTVSHKYISDLFQKVFWTLAN